MAQVGDACRYGSDLLMLALHCPAGYQRLVGFQRIPVMEEPIELLYARLPPPRCLKTSPNVFTSLIKHISIDQVVMCAQQQLHEVTARQKMLAQIPDKSRSSKSWISGDPGGIVVLFESAGGVGSSAGSI